jgi:hypothetical protein
MRDECYGSIILILLAGQRKKIYPSRRLRRESNFLWQHILNTGISRILGIFRLVLLPREDVACP